MTAQLKRLRSALLRVSAFLLALLLALLVTLDFAQVVMRYVLGTGWSWAGDVSVIMLLSLGWMGAGHLWLSRSHIVVDLLPGSDAGRRLRVWLDTAASIAVVAGVVILLPMIVTTIETYGLIVLPALGVSGAVKYWPVMAGATYLAVAAALDLAIRIGEPDQPGLDVDG